MDTAGDDALKIELESMLSNDLVDGLAGRAGLVDKLLLHAQLTLAANQRLNLTSIVEPRDVAFFSSHATRLYTEFAPEGDPQKNFALDPSRRGGIIDRVLVAVRIVPDAMASSSTWMRIV